MTTTTPRRSPALLAGLTALGLVLVACSTTPEAAPESSSTAQASPTPSPSATEASTTSELDDAPVVEIPATPVGEQIAWTIAALAPGATLDPADAESRLSPPALEQLDGAALAQTFAGIAATGPWEPISYEGEDYSAIAQLRDAGGQRLDLTVVVNAEGLVEQLLFQPPFDHEPAASWDELGTAVEALPADTTLVVTDVTDPAAPAEVFASGEDGAFPVGSVFKLYVLGAVTDAVAAGTLAWDTELTLTDDVKSMPSGTLQDEPAGTVVTVRQAAEAMIAISDNTATDLLIQAVGRESVEAQLPVMGHSDPALNTPLLATRELFLLGWGGDDARREAWASGDAAERRAILAALPAGPPGIDPLTISATVWQDGLDWFATPDDLVAAHLSLQERADTPAGEPLTAILGANPGIEPAVAGAFEEVAFKGGSSMGVLALTHHYRDADGAWVVTLQAHSDSQTDVADLRPYVAAAQDAAILLSGS
ncbi:serine hydrolase [Serinibacter arcticus]|uniref:Beta-lactamase n=1 Tax=Serinibacter arcticus TaxID=1655435 RepID=A0A4Z1E6G3_9MICO|nr:serine hydrolase [Serinibacter arcticus]TGO06458.1 Beta-lactamase [Serinibacter arcticus]